MYQHEFIRAEHLPLLAGKAICVGRNYLDHIKELDNEVPEQPILFAKSNNCFVSMHDPIRIPTSGECHNELEIALLIGKPLGPDTAKNPLDAVVGIGLGLDLTLRNVQQVLKEKGLPWERAKAFDGSCPLSTFVPFQQDKDLQDLKFTLAINGEIRQQGHTKMMINSCERLLQEVVSVFSLYPGDVVMTGTPKGVGKLEAGDNISATLEGIMSVNTVVTTL